MSRRSPGTKGAREEGVGDDVGDDVVGEATNLEPAGRGWGPVGSMPCRLVVSGRKWMPGRGSSIVLSRALPAPSPSASAGSTTTTYAGALVGRVGLAHVTGAGAVNRDRAGLAVGQQPVDIGVVAGEHAATGRALAAALGRSLRAQQGAREAAGEGGFADAARADRHERVVQLPAREGPGECDLGRTMTADPGKPTKAAPAGIASRIASRIADRIANRIANRIARAVRGGVNGASRAGGWKGQA